MFGGEAQAALREGHGGGVLEQGSVLVSSDCHAKDHTLRGWLKQQKFTFS